MNGKSSLFSSRYLGRNGRAQDNIKNHAAGIISYGL